MEMEELFFKPIDVSADDMNKFQEKEMTKKRPFVKSTQAMFTSYRIGFCFVS